MIRMAWWQIISSNFLTGPETLIHSHSLGRSRCERKLQYIPLKNMYPQDAHCCCSESKKNVESYYLACVYIIMYVFNVHAYMLRYINADLFYITISMLPGYVGSSKDFIFINTFNYHSTTPKMFVAKGLRRINGAGLIWIDHLEQLLQIVPHRCGRTWWTIFCAPKMEQFEGPSFSRMRSEGSRFIWGSGGEAVFAESCVYVGNRSRATTTVCVTAVRLSTVASAPGVVLRACQVDCVSPQLYWRLQRVSDLCRRIYISVCRGGVCVSDLCRRSYIGVCSGGVCVSDLCRRSYIDICSGGVCVTDACRRSYIDVRRRGVCVSDLCRRSFIGVRRGVVSVIDLRRRSYIGVCRGGVCVSDLRRRS